MRQEAGHRQEVTDGKVPVRGTQSFVGVMGVVWRRPSLMALEVWWRWLAGAIVLALAYVAFGDYGVEWAGLDMAPLRAATVFQPVEGLQVLQGAFASVWRYASPSLKWLLPAVVAVWLIASAVGRTLVLRRLDPTLNARRGTMFALGSLRAGLLAVAWALWVGGIGWALRVEITRPAARGAEPSLVGFTAILIVGTLLLYVLWGVVSWFLQLAPLLAMRLNVGAIAALQASLRSRAVRGKLIEINLVMHIVKLALIVLAMVFSASSLPLVSVSTQTFLVSWSTVVVLLYFAMSDYFHVVRAAAYLALWRTYHPEVE